jgi:hypothetical protein
VKIRTSKSRTAAAGGALAANNYMKTLFIVTLIFTTLNCVPQQVSQYQKSMRGSDKFVIKKIGEYEKLLEYPDYNVIIKGNRLGCGEKITIINYKYHDTLISIQAGPIYFYGIYKNYLFIDKGTGHIRDLMIFNLQGQNFIFSSRYENPPILKSDSIFYEYPFTHSREIIDFIPECPDSVKKFNQYGYSEDRVFILGSRKSINTGKIKCEYRE